MSTTLMWTGLCKLCLGSGFYETTSAQKRCNDDCKNSADSKLIILSAVKRKILA